MNAAVEKTPRTISFDGFPSLVLNADHRPLSFRPLSLSPWQDVVKAVFQERVDVVREYDAEIRSPSFTMRIPSVVALREYRSQENTPAFTRYNVSLRDDFCCQYCNAEDDLTWDHYVPRSKGGHTCWDNIVTACVGCNSKKGNLLVGTKDYTRKGLRTIPAPHAPTFWELQAKAANYPPNHFHETWLDYAYWDAEFEPAGKDGWLKPKPARSAKSRFLRQAGLHAA